MRAAILTSPRSVVVVDDMPEPECGAGEVVVGVTATGICGTDLAYVEGAREIPEAGLIVGHEPFGTIVAVGDDVSASRIGERVAVEPNYPCGRCSPCAAARPSLCVSRRSPVVTEQGFLAERVAVPADFAWPLPASISDEDAACIEPLAVAMAALRRAGTIEGVERIGIIGAGSIGRILADVLVRRGAQPAMLDLSPQRLALAEQLGARTAREGDRFQVIFDTSGSGDAITAAIERLEAMGTMIVVGVGDDAFEVPTKTLVRRGLTLRGSMIYDHHIDYAEVIAAVSSGRASPGRVLGEPFELDRAAEALLGASDRVRKTWIRLTGGDSDA